MTLLLESALRSSLLGLLVWAVLKLMRARDSATQTISWTFVLGVALLMPLLSHSVPRFIVAVPHLSATTPVPAGSGLSAATQISPARPWLLHHAQFLVLAVYLLGLLVCLTRLVTGLVLTLRLYLGTEPVAADWARGRRIRTSAAVKSPASLARTVLLPADFPTWGAAKRQAVLAHEEAHIARGDFFVQLAASLHCVLFWFNPFAWWLRSKLAEVAESASDEAAVRHLDDPFMYAEILLEVARGAGSAALLVAMAKGHLIQQRIDRILSETSSGELGLPSRVTVLAALMLAALAVASAQAALSQAASPTASRPATLAASRGTSPATASPGTAPPAIRSHRRTHRVAPVRKVASPSPAPEEVSYNPRALLDPVFSSTARPIREVAVADGGYR